MPVYEYACQHCGYSFEKMRRMSESSASTSCPKCNAENVKKLVSAANHSFAHVPVGGPRPQNTGVHAIDYSADRVIGRDAEQRWNTIRERQDVKMQVLKQTPGATGFDLSRMDEGGYRVMKPEERGAVDAARSIHRQALDAIDATRAKK